MSRITLKARLLKYTKRFLIVALIAFVTLTVARFYALESGPSLGVWHTYEPKELSIKEMEQANWQTYLDAEQRIFKDVQDNVTNKLDESGKVPSNRYYSESPIYPGKFKNDWNHSYEIEPDQTLKGVAVFFHGLTDSPYSLRHIARRYAASGYKVYAIRLPGHGTVPAGLSHVEWEEWMAAVRLVIREARQKTGDKVPLHLVGFSNGGALALKYTLDSLDDNQLRTPDKLVLISPMIGVTRFARFAGVAGWPAILPAFSKTSWLGIMPEFNPFKYNSFPVNGAVQSHRLTSSLQRQITEMSTRPDFATRMPPVLTFQSVMDFTVSTRAIIDALYDRLPANGSELVLFDINRHTKVNILFRRTTENAIERMLPRTPRAYRTVLIRNIALNDPTVKAWVTEAGTSATTPVDLSLEYPREVYSLSHVSIPFPMSDSLYGLQPDPSDEDFGINLGVMATRGERGALIVNTDALSRMASNPFYPYMIQRIEAGM